MTPLTIAVWMGDDGYVHNGKVGFCTDNFNDRDVELLREAIKKWGINTRRHKHMIRYERIYVEGGFMGRLKELIGGYLHESMWYKLGDWK